MAQVRHVVSSMSAVVNWSPIRYVRPSDSADIHKVELLPEIFGGLLHDLGRATVDVRKSPFRAMPPHHVKACRIQFGYDEKAPLQPLRLLLGLRRKQAAFRRRIFSGKVGGDRGALADRQCCILQQVGFFDAD